MSFAGPKKVIYIMTIILVIAAVVSGVALSKRIPEDSRYLEFAPLGQGCESRELKIMTGGSVKLHGMDLVANRNGLELYLDRKTCDVAVYDQSSGHIWYSYPQNRGNDPIANNSEKDLMSSHLTVKFFDYYRRLNTFNSYADSIDLGQFEIFSIDNGIRIVYKIGDLSPGVNLLPHYISMDRLEEKILSKFTESDRKYFTDYYPESTDKPGFRQRSLLVERSVMITRKMVRLIQEAGYTEDDLLEEVRISGELPQSLTKPHVVIPLEFILQDDALLVRIPADEIVENEVTLVSQIEFMKFFGSGTVTDEGYIFVPNGSGGLIDLNNGKITSEEYVQSVYGTDFTTQNFINQQVVTNVKLPVYGQKVNDQAFLAIIEEADSLATIKANISGKTNSFNTVYPTFLLRKYDTATVDLSNDLAVVEKNLFSGNIEVAYHFLNDNDASYAGMANMYRKYLTDKSILKPLEDMQDLPFFADILGSVSTNEHIFGIPYTHDKKLTSFSEAQQIVEQMADMGFRNMQIRLVGWFNHGIYHTFPLKINIDDRLGGARGLKQLNEAVTARGGTLYPDTAFLEVSMSSRNFNSSEYAVRYVIGTKALTGNVLPPTMQFGSIYGVRDDEWRYLLTPSVILPLTDRFIDRYSRFDIGAVSLRDMGDSLSSDKRRSDPIDREHAMNIVREGLLKFSSRYELMLSDPNAYALAYTSKAVNVPVEMNNFMIMDRSVPFLQMVIHGSVDYASVPINSTDHQFDRRLLLKLIETGTIPRYTLTYAENSSIKSTTANQFLSVHYSDWVDNAKEYYDIVNGLLSDVRSLPIISHEYITGDVVKVTYQDGTEIWVNYGIEDYLAGDFEVKALGYSKKVGK